MMVAWQPKTSGNGAHAHVGPYTLNVLQYSRGWYYDIVDANFKKTYAFAYVESEEAGRAQALAAVSALLGDGT